MRPKRVRDRGQRETYGGPVISVTTFSLFRFPAIRDRLWVFTQMAASRRPLAATPGIGFAKLFGSGTGEGFTPKPNTAIWGLLATWPDEATARRGASEGVFARWAGHAAESWTIFLSALSARGRWSGAAPFKPEADPGCGPLAVLTRATIRPASLLRFWRHEPAVSARIGADPNVIFKIGVGEAPWLQQVTFSIWPDEERMCAFARRGPHQEAIRAVREGGWFAEELYARFRVIGEAGAWSAAPPLLAGAEA